MQGMLEGGESKGKILDGDMVKEDGEGWRFFVVTAGIARCEGEEGSERFVGKTKVIPSGMNKGRRRWWWGGGDDKNPCIGKGIGNHLP